MTSFITAIMNFIAAILAIVVLRPMRVRAEKCSDHVKIAVIGAGAIGGYVWVACRGGRGRHLYRAWRQPRRHPPRGHAADQEDGAESSGAKRRIEKTSEAGPQDVVVLAVKAHQVGAIAADLAALCHDETAIVTMQNGIPWWYFHKHGGEYEGTPVRSRRSRRLDRPLIDADRVIGCVVYPAAKLVAPGVVHVVEGNRFTLGEPDGSTSPRAQAISRRSARRVQGAGDRRHSQRDLAQAVGQSELQSDQRADARDAGSNLLQFPLTRELGTQMMREAEAVANKLGITFRVGIDKRIAGAEKVGEHKTSMLQDVEAGTADGDRGAGRRGRRARPPYGYADAAHRRRLRAREPAGQAARRHATASLSSARKSRRTARQRSTVQTGMTAGTISELLKHGADDAPALSSPGGTPLTYRGFARSSRTSPHRSRRRVSARAIASASCSTTVRRWRRRS